MKIQPGTLCRVECASSSYNNEIVKFMDHTWSYYEFEMMNGTKFRLYSEHEFIILPDEEGLKGLIELALMTWDREWFIELVERLELIQEWRGVKK